MKCFILYSKDFSRYSKINYCDRLFDEKQAKLIFYQNLPKISSENITIKDIQKYRIRKDITPKGDGNKFS